MRIEYRRVSFIALVIFAGLLFISGLGFADSFSDLPSSHWIYDDLLKLADAGLIEEYHGGEALYLRPPLTRYEVALILGRVYERLDNQQREQVEKHLFDSPFGEQVRVTNLLAAMDQSLWERLFNYVLMADSQVPDGGTVERVASIRLATARAADALKRLSTELADEMTVLGLYSFSGSKEIHATNEAARSKWAGQRSFRLGFSQLTDPGGAQNQSPGGFRSLGDLGLTEIGSSPLELSHEGRTFLLPQVESRLRPIVKFSWLG